MDWVQFIIFIGSTVGLFFWNRSESRSDMRHMMAIIDGIQKEMKDFHGRLCAIEERNKK
ncbi:hypothetical protein UFOVP256_25 [uncultured Caudovirales phage]|uniref:Holin n=1 Tax=uncultured Caudovirales phage TaxID=2100421 RepID=A0A6J5LGF1_9CAUD|nr:hypothetical protein UFOVP256_25 [uncultured Caudovirales phage]